MENYIVAVKFVDTNIFLDTVADVSWKDALTQTLVNLNKGREDISYNDIVNMALETTNSLSDDLEEAYQEAFDQDWEFVIKII